MIRDFKNKFSEENYSFIIKIVLFICLTNIPSLLLLKSFYSESIGWLFGTLGSLINFIWLSISVSDALMYGEQKANIKSTKNFFFRFMFLILYSVGIIITFKPMILVFGIGLLSAQMAIFIVGIYTSLINGRYNKN